MGGWRETEDSYSEMHEGSFLYGLFFRFQLIGPWCKAYLIKRPAAENKATFLVNIER